MKIQIMKVSFSGVPPETKEVSYFEGAMKLYKLIQKKQWEEAVCRYKNYPNEVSTWIIRNNHDGQMKWKILPIHAALLFHASVRQIKTILCVYPYSI